MQNDPFGITYIIPEPFNADIMYDPSPGEDWFLKEPDIWHYQVELNLILKQSMNIDVNLQADQRIIT